MTLAPPLPGDVVHHEIDDETLYVQSGAFVAADRGIELDTTFGGTRSSRGSSPSSRPARSRVVEAQRNAS